VEGSRVDLRQGNALEGYQRLPQAIRPGARRTMGVDVLPVGQEASEALAAGGLDLTPQDLYDNHGLALVRDLGPHINDVVDTIALLKELDLVICCESALGHICALAGKECWLPYSYLGKDYRLGLDGTDMIWTPSHQVFRQSPDMRWEPVFNKIAIALQEKIDGLDREASKAGTRVRPGSKALA